MISAEIVNKVLGIKESYQAPEKLMDRMMDDQRRKETFDEFLKYETDMSKEWFHAYFEDEHADRKAKKQDFTPNSVSNLLSRITGVDDSLYYEVAAGTGGILIQYWQEQRCKYGPFKYNPRAFWYQAEELSDRSIPFLIFNMAIRGINGVILHGDALSREFKAVYFIRNNTSDYQSYSEVIEVPKTKSLMQEFNIKKWIDD